MAAQVDPQKCTSCGVCARVCPYNAIEVDVKAKSGAKVITAACAGCGTCAAECKFDAIEIQHFTDAMIYAQIDTALEDKPEEKIITFLCNWCSYAASDMAGVSRIQYHTHNRYIRVMCSGRVAEEYIMHAFKKGAPVVLLSGCHIADCHYITANHWTLRRADRLWTRLEKLGIRPERLQLEWISAAEGPRFAQVMEGMEEFRKQVTPEEIEFTKKAIAEDEARAAAKKAARAEAKDEADAETAEV